MLGARFTLHFAALAACSAAAVHRLLPPPPPAPRWAARSGRGSARAGLCPRRFAELPGLLLRRAEHLREQQQTLGCLPKCRLLQRSFFTVAKERSLATARVVCYSKLNCGAEQLGSPALCLGFKPVKTPEGFPVLLC